MMPLSAENRGLAGVQGGQKVEVTIAPDDQPREVDIPPALAEALASSPSAQERFDRLSPSAKKRHVLALQSAKTEDTRARRLSAVLAELSHV
jgi:uncharacterized protein YdeI (YjbR/CyaY-like superfamily)